MLMRLLRKGKRRNDVARIGPSQHPSGRFALSIVCVLGYMGKMSEECSILGRTHTILRVRQEADAMIMVVEVKLRDSLWLA